MVVGYGMLEEEEAASWGGMAEHANNFQYLTLLIAGGKCLDEEVGRHITSAFMAFGASKRAVFRDLYLFVNTERLACQAYILSVLHPFSAASCIAVSAGSSEKTFEVTEHLPTCVRCVWCRG